MKEIWKDIDLIVGYEHLYQISNLGQVRSLDRIDAKGRKRKGRVLTSKGVSFRGCSLFLYPCVQSQPHPRYKPRKQPTGAEGSEKDDGKKHS